MKKDYIHWSCRLRIYVILISCHHNLVTYDNKDNENEKILYSYRIAEWLTAERLRSCGRSIL